MNMAYVLRQGTIYPDVIGLPVVLTFPVGGHQVCKYPLGMPVILAMVSVAGWSAALGTNLLVHLLTFCVLVRLLRRLQTPALFALLYLLHPTAVIYSRTVMADPVSGLLIALTFDAYLSRRRVLCGALVGASLLARTGNMVALLAFGAALLLESVPTLTFAAAGLADSQRRISRDGLGRWKKRLASVAAFGAGAMPFVAAALYYAQVVAGGQMGSHTGTFALHYFPQMFPGYVLGLMLLYPAMLLMPLAYSGPGKRALALACYGFVLLYSFWYYRDQGNSALETLIVGQRYFLAVLPLFVVAYATVIWRVVQSWPVKAAKALTVSALAGISLLLVSTVAVSRRHAAFVGRMAQVRTGLLRLTPTNATILCNTQVGKLFHPGWGLRDVRITGGEPTAGNVAQARARAEAGMTRLGGSPVFVALWIRPAHGDDVKEARLLNRLCNEVTVRPLSAAERGDLPEQVTVRRIVRLGRDDKTR